jgi:Pyruvate/2-oxoacid:ferredoxin oxidoreductase delta subunit
VSSALDSTKIVATYDDFRATVEKQDFISVRPCMCRRGAELLGNPCDRPMETEIAFGLLGRYAIQNGTGREISVNEALHILDEAEKAGLVLAPINTKEDIGCCMCCDCCCLWLRALNKFERPVDHVLSRVQARIVPELCTSCGICLERCQMNAIVEGDQCNEIDVSRCIGCGLCRPTCEEGAIELVPRPESEEPPESLADMFIGIAAKRGVG